MMEAYWCNGMLMVRLEWAPVAIPSASLACQPHVHTKRSHTHTHIDTHTKRLCKTNTNKIMGRGFDERTCKKNHTQLCMLNTHWHKQRLAKASAKLYFFHFLCIVHIEATNFDAFYWDLFDRPTKNKEVVIVNRVSKIWKVRWPFMSSPCFSVSPFTPITAEFFFFCISDESRYQLASRMSFAVSSIQRGVFSTLQRFALRSVGYILFSAERSSVLHMFVVSLTWIVVKCKQDFLWVPGNKAFLNFILFFLLLFHKGQFLGLQG